VSGLGAVAGAQDIDALVDDVVFRGYAVEQGVDADVNEIEDSLAGLDGVAVVVLADDPATGADRVADDVRAGVAEPITVLVISPGEVGATSDSVNDRVLDDALDTVIDDLDAGRGVGATTARFADAIGVEVPASIVDSSDGDTSDTSTGSGDDGGGSGVGLLVVLLIVAALGVGLFVFLRRRARKVDDGDITSAKAEIHAQLAAVATEIVDNEGSVEVSGNAEAVALFREANVTYTRVSEEIEATTNLLDLAELNDDVDRARWQLEASEALVAGRTPPPEPAPDAPAACFFDPTHRPGTEEATIRTAAGDKEVRVCTSCADRLRRGEQPEPRMIEVGGRPVPAAKAPRSHGGLGMGGLSIFEIILGGLGALGAARGSDRSERSGAGAGIDWGSMVPGSSRRSSSRTTSSRASSSGSSGSFGMDRLPSRPRTLPRTAASRPSGQRSRSTSSKGPAAGRARRRR